MERKSSSTLIPPKLRHFLLLQTQTGGRLLVRFQRRNFVSYFAVGGGVPK
jgi:hypothetical protein